MGGLSRVVSSLGKFQGSVPGEVERVKPQAGAFQRGSNNRGKRQHARAFELQAVEDTEIGEGQADRVVIGTFVRFLVELRVERAAPEQPAVTEHVKAHRARFDGVEVDIGAVARAFNPERGR
ncbi:hypothetical protein EVA_04301 [gut metagenome]|uniref:Uncharacterized protein n=1 Tax=gut metagenome TaxID=749906 RepID=J9H272_9ZZZZ